MGLCSALKEKDECSWRSSYWTKLRLRKMKVTHFLSFVYPRVYKDTQHHFCTYAMRGEVKLGKQRRLERRVVEKKEGHGGDYDQNTWYNYMKTMFLTVTTVCNKYRPTQKGMFFVSFPHPWPLWPAVWRSYNGWGSSTVLYQKCESHILETTGDNGGRAWILEHKPVWGRHKHCFSCGYGVGCVLLTYNWTNSSVTWRRHPQIPISSCHNLC